MNIGPAIARYILTIPGVAQLMGSRIYPDGLPQRMSARIRNQPIEQAQLPAVTYSLISSGPEYHLSAEAISGFTTGRYQITVYGISRGEADNLAEMIRGDQAGVPGLENYRGPIGDAETGVAIIDSCFVANWLTDKQQPTTGSNKPRYLVLADYLVQHHY